MPSYSFAIATFECTCGLGQKPGQTANLLKTRPDARTKAKKRTCPGKTGRMVTLDDDAAALKLSDVLSVHSLTQAAQPRIHA